LECRRMILLTISRGAPDPHRTPRLHFHHYTDIRFMHCQQCKIRACNQEKGNSGCHECDDFPCQHIENLPMTIGKKVILRAVPFHFLSCNHKPYFIFTESCLCYPPPIDMPPCGIILMEYHYRLVIATFHAHLLL
jgi:hypothetical protein